MRLVGSLRNEIEDRGHCTVANQSKEASHEQIRRCGEQLAGLTDPPEVRRRDGADREQTEGDAIGKHARQRRGDGGDAGGNAHGDRQDVIDQQRGRGHQAREDPEVVLGDDVRAPAFRVRANRLAVRADDDGDEQRDGNADRQRIAQRQM